ncbi:MAG: iron ABC transporter permease [Pseudomonadota bacterium]
MKGLYTVNLLLIVLSVIAVIAACFIGSTALPASSIAKALLLQGTPGDHIVLWEIRLPRAIAAFLVGASLGMSGAAMQGLFRNPLADPGVLGVSACASLAATVAIYYGLTLMSAWVLPMAAIFGALSATILLAVANRYTKSVVTLLLIGVALSSFTAAVMALLLNLAPNPFSLSDMLNWSLGSVANRGLYDIGFALPFMTAGLICLLAAQKGLDLLTLGEGAAMSLGLRLAGHRYLVVAGTGLMTGGAVALAGAIGFVGLIAPHIIRPFVDYRPSQLLVPSAFLGGTLLVLADICVRVMPTSNELNLGVMAALFGAPVFVWIVVQRRGSYV